MEIEKMVLARMTSPSRSVMEPTRQISMYADYAECIDVSPDGQYLLTGGGDARLWCLRTGKELRRFIGRENSRVICVGFFPDGIHGWAGHDDGLMRIYDLFADGRTVATGRRRTQAGSWESYQVEEGCEPKRVLRCSWATTHGKRLLLGTGVSGGRGIPIYDCHEILKWDWRKRVALASWKIGQNLPTTRIPDEEDTDTPEIRTSLTACRISPDGQLIVGAAVTYEYYRSPWSHLGTIETNFMVTNLVTEQTMYFHKANYCCNDIEFSADSKHVFIGGTPSSALEVRETSTWTLVRRQSGHLGKINCIRRMPDGRRIVSGSHDGCLIVWNIDTGARELQLHCGVGGLKMFAVSPCGTRLYTLVSRGTIGEFRL